MRHSSVILPVKVMYLSATRRNPRPNEYWRHFATEKRILSSLEFLFENPEIESVVV